MMYQHRFYRLAERSNRHSQELAKQGSGMAAGPELAALRWKSETGWSTKKPPKQSIWRATKELTPYEKRQKGSARGEDGTKWHLSQGSAPANLARYAHGHTGTDCSEEK